MLYTQTANKNIVFREITSPTWMMLDNAAKIYPAAKSKRTPAMFRLSMELSEDIDKDILQLALDRTLNRMPGFSQHLKSGLFWYYLEHQNDSPDVCEDANNPCVYLDTKANKNFLVRVRYYKRKIAAEFFHVLTDGTGGLCFLKTLVAEYLSIKYDVNIPRNSEILDCEESAKASELEDSFLKYSRSVKKSRKESPAYHISGTREEVGVIHITTAIMSLHEIRYKAMEYGATVNEFLTSVLIMAIYSIQQEENNIMSRNKPVKVCVPVNLRKYYGSNTLRNFASYVNVGIDPSLGEYSLEEIIAIVKHTMALGATEKVLNAKMSTNVSSEKNGVIRALPLIIKNPIMKLIHFLVGDRYNSCTLSNLGLVTLPEEMSQYVQKIDFMLGAGQNPISCSCIGYEKTVSFNISRTITESVVERLFFTRLVKMGIHTKLESNQR
jgi:NRPS condensation-like uncharacterized protein